MSEDTYEREGVNISPWVVRRDEARLARIMELDTAGMPTEGEGDLVLTEGTNKVSLYWKDTAYGGEGPTSLGTCSVAGRGSACGFSVSRWSYPRSRINRSTAGRQ